MIQQRTRLIAGVGLLVLAALLFSVLVVGGFERSALVYVRWAPTVDEATTTRLEHVLHLRRVEPVPPRTWAYYLTDVSTASIRRVVENPAVEDTHFIDRATFQLDPAAVRGPYVSPWVDVTAFAARTSLLFGIIATALWVIHARSDRRVAASQPRTAVPGTDTSAGGSRSRLDVVFLVLLVAALAVRLFLASTATYIHDEENTSIPLSKTISFSPGSLNLPLRGENHGALPAYLVKASSSLFGTSPLAHRAVHVFFGLCAVLLVYVLTNQMFGSVAARWSAALMAFNEYFLSFSSRATANTPFLVLVTTAVFVFSRFLVTERPAYLYGTAVAAGLAFYCKEHAVLLLPVFLAMLLTPRYRRWLRSAHAYLAVAVFAIAIGPDVLWNLRANPETAKVSYGEATLGQATYAAHLQRIGGFGFSPYPTMFYAHEPMMRLMSYVEGEELPDITPEYHAVNAALGLLLVASVLMTILAPAGHDPRRLFLLFLACGVFAFFTLVKRGDPPFRLAAVSWVWVEATLVPAVILAGGWLAGLTGKWRALAWAFSAIALAYAVDSLTWAAIQ
ncbi:MAG: phospholipid carrier-dependent glycosyltransferase [Acidobacteria bacterium]|nr:phospholipid carrier-dependent glycosyltransferase [Acidobacteriota bacterium]